MSYSSVGPAENAQDGPDRKPWEQQPDEPPDLYGWFKVYLILPQPRRIADVAQFANMNPRSGWLSKLARKWGWKERAAAFDADGAQRFAVLSEQRSQLLKDVGFNAQYQGLHLTGRALENAAIGEMDRDEARRYLSALFQHKLGLLKLLTPRKEKTGKVKINENQLEMMAMDRAIEIREERIMPLINKIYGITDSADGADADKEPGSGPSTAEQKETRP
ncbi:MAG: hypothetical protein OXO48_17650 [Caldilineaceae bacterium]|nr:hypothetical protein [Caldilineaceae bacterium]MDE0430988.1 hypothetical protein [Caldilineaceae bacterium]